MSSDAPAGISLDELRRVRMASRAAAASPPEYRDLRPTPQSLQPGPTGEETALSDDEEAQFRAWKQTNAPQDSGEDYDLRGAFKSGLKPDAASGHWPDTFKKSNHPTFSDESQYASRGRPGRWVGPNRDQFEPPAEEPAAPPDKPQSMSLAELRMARKMKAEKAGGISLDELRARRAGAVVDTAPQLGSAPGMTSALDKAPAPHVTPEEFAKRRVQTLQAGGVRSRDIAAEGIDPETGQPRSRAALTMDALAKTGAGYPEAVARGVVDPIEQAMETNTPATWAKGIARAGFGALMAHPAAAPFVVSGQMHQAAQDPDTPDSLAGDIVTAPTRGFEAGMHALPDFEKQAAASRAIRLDPRADMETRSEAGITEDLSEIGQIANELLPAALLPAAHMAAAKGIPAGLRAVSPFKAAPKIGIPEGGVVGEKAPGVTPPMRRLPAPEPNPFMDAPRAPVEAAAAGNLPPAEPTLTGRELAVLRAKGATPRINPFRRPTAYGTQNVTSGPAANVAKPVEGPPAAFATPRTDAPVPQGTPGVDLPPVDVPPSHRTAIVPDRGADAARAVERQSVNDAAPSRVRNAVHRGGFRDVHEAWELVRRGDETSIQTLPPDVVDALVALEPGKATPVQATRVPESTVVRPAALEPEAPPKAPEPAPAPAAAKPTREPVVAPRAPEGPAEPRDRAPTPEEQTIRRRAKEETAVLDEQTNPVRAPREQPPAQGPQPRRLDYTPPEESVPRSPEPAPEPAPEQPRSEPVKPVATEPVVPREVTEKAAPESTGKSAKSLAQPEATKPVAEPAVASINKPSTSAEPSPAPEPGKIQETVRSEPISPPSQGGGPKPTEQSTTGEPERLTGNKPRESEAPLQAEPPLVARMRAEPAADARARIWQEQSGDPVAFRAERSAAETWAKAEIRAKGLTPKQFASGRELVDQAIRGEDAPAKKPKVTDPFKRAKKAETPERPASPEPAVTEPPKGTSAQGAAEKPQQVPEAGKVPAEAVAPEASKMTRSEFKDWYTDPVRAIAEHEKALTDLRAREKPAPQHKLADIRSEIARREAAIEKAKRGERIELTDAQWDAQHPDGAAKPSVPEPVQGLIRRAHGGLRTDGPAGVIRTWADASAAERTAFTDHLKASGDPLAGEQILPAEKFRRFVEKAPVEPEAAKAEAPSKKDPFKRKSKRGETGGAGDLPTGKGGVPTASGLLDSIDRGVNKGLKATAEAISDVAGKGMEKTREALTHLPGKGAPVIKFLDSVRNGLAKVREVRRKSFVYGPKRIDAQFPGYDAATETWRGGRNEAAAWSTRIKKELTRGFKKLSPAAREAIHDYMDSSSPDLPDAAFPKEIKGWIDEYVRLVNEGRDAMVDLGILSPESRAEYPRFMKRIMMNEINEIRADASGSRARIPEIHRRRDGYSYEIQAPEDFVRAVADRAGLDIEDTGLVSYLRQNGRFTTIKFKPVEGVASAMHEAAWKQFRETMKEMLASGRKGLLESFNTEVVGAKPGKGKRYVTRSAAERRAAASQARMFIEARKDMPTMSDLLVNVDEPLTPEMRKVMGESRNTAEVAAKTLNEIKGAVADAEFLKTVADRWATERETWYENGKRVEGYVPEGWVAMEGDKMGALKGKLLPESMAQDIKGYFDIRAEGDPIWTGIIDHAIRGTSEWKRWRTIRNPRNYAQNAMSLPAEMLEAGVNPVADAHLIKEVTRRLLKNDIYDPKMQEWTKANVTDSQFISELNDIDSGAKKGHALLNPALLSENGRALFEVIDEVGGRAYNFGSEIVRATAYEKARARGLTLEQAVAEVNESTTNFRRVSPFVKQIRRTPFAPFATYATERLRIMKNNLAKHPTRVAATLLYIQAVRRLTEEAYARMTGDRVTDEEKEGVRRQRGGMFQQVPVLRDLTNFTTVTGHNDDGSVNTKDLGPAIPFDQPFRGPRVSLDPGEQVGEWVQWALESAGGSLGPVPAAGVILASGVTPSGKRVEGAGEKTRAIVQEFSPPFFYDPTNTLEPGQQLSKLIAANEGEQTSKYRPADTPLQAFMNAFLYIRSAGYDPRLALKETDAQRDRAVTRAKRARTKSIEKDPTTAKDAWAEYGDKVKELNAAEKEWADIHREADKDRPKKVSK